MPPIGGPSSLYQRDLIPRPVFSTRNSSKSVRGRGHVQKINVINIFKYIKKTIPHICCCHLSI